jgi:hypothetical protein
MSIFTNLTVSSFHRLFLLSLFIIYFFVNPNQAIAQDCNGFMPGTIGGGLIQLTNGDICANTATIPGGLRIVANNVNDLNNPANVRFIVNWGDGSTQTLSGAIVSAGYLGVNSHAYQIDVTHFYPAAGASVSCVYTPNVNIEVGGTTCFAYNPTPPTYIRWNTDNQNSGVLNIVSSPPHRSSKQLFGLRRSDYNDNI